MQSEEQSQKRMKKNEQSLREIWDNIMHPNIHILGVPEGKERKEGTEKYLKTYD